MDPGCVHSATGQGRHKVRAHDAGLRPHFKKKLGSRVAQRGLGRHGSIENLEMVRVVGHTGWDKIVSRANSGADVDKFNIRLTVKVPLCKSPDAGTQSAPAWLFS